MSQCSSDLPTNAIFQCFKNELFWWRLQPCIITKMRLKIAEFGIFLESGNSCKSRHFWGVHLRLRLFNGRVRFSLRKRRPVWIKMKTWICELATLSNDHLSVLLLLLCAVVYNHAQSVINKDWTFTLLWPAELRFCTFLKTTNWISKSWIKVATLIV